MIAAARRAVLGLWPDERPEFRFKPRAKALILRVHLQRRHAWIDINPEEVLSSDGLQPSEVSRIAASIEKSLGRPFCERAGSGSASPAEIFFEKDQGTAVMSGASPEVDPDDDEVSGPYF